MNDKTYEKRFSEHIALWIIIGIAVLAIHFYIYLRIRAAIGSGWRSSIWLAWSFAMMEILFISRRTRRITSRIQRKWTDRVGGIWMLFVIMSFLLLAVNDLIMHFTGIGFPLGYDLLVSFGLSSIMLMLGVNQANTIQTTIIKVPTSKLPEGCDSLRIVQLTDLHLGPFVGVRLLEQILRKVREVKPDIVVVTGDLADGKLKGRTREIAMLRRIKPKFGVYAVTGNHDYYDDIDEAVSFMESSGMKVLRCEGIEVAGILIVGAEDKDHLIKKQWNLTCSETLVLSFERQQREKFLLLLRHRPIVETGTEGHFDLQLSGHTHGGQLFPLLSSRHKIVGHPRGLKKLKCGGLLYVSNGAGFVGPPVRLLAPPEIAVFDLVRANGST